MRTINDHTINTFNEHLKLVVLDEPGVGGANHEYLLSLEPPDYSASKSLQISFQNGPVKEAGYNGWTQEILLAVVIDRLRSFQAGPFSCRENAIALTKLEEALMWLQKRTLDRLKRGVEGLNQE